MNIRVIKKVNEKIPYFIKRPFSKIIRSKLIKNKVFLATYAQLNEFDASCHRKKAEIQLKELQHVLLHAYNHTAYYKKLFNEIGFDPENFKSLSDLKKIPVLSKADLKKNFDSLLADDIDDFYLVSTGGSTGEPTKIQMERDAIYKEWAFVYHYWEKFGYDYNKSRLATFRGVDLGAKISEINPLYNEIRLNPFLLNEKNIAKYIKKIDKFNAEFIYGYPSIIYNFCRMAKKNNMFLKGKFKAAFLISENLYEFQEKVITEVLECKVAMFYGHSERAVFGEKYVNGYRFNSMYGVTEISTFGEPIVTGFINQKMPLIRYVVDDKVKTVDGENYVIEGHHTCEVLYGVNGEEISGAMINFHDNTFDNVKCYQFIQEEKGKCCLIVVADEGAEVLDIEKIQKRVQKKLGSSIICEVAQGNNINVSNRGKYQMIVQKKEDNHRNRFYII